MLNTESHGNVGAELVRANAARANTELAVIGGGPGGYAAAFMAADLGIKTTLIDVEKNPGGTCLYRGCIPSKALLHVAKVISEAREAAGYGITFQPPEIDLPKLRDSVTGIIGKLTGGLGQLCRAHKLDYVQGRALFLDSNRLKIYKANGEEEELQYEKAILASGSRPSIIEKLMLDSPRVMNSTAALLMPDIPHTLLVIGGGYIGLELGSVYAALGTRVTIVEALPALLTGADKDLVDPLTRRIETIVAEIIYNAKVTAMREVENGVEVDINGTNIEPPTRLFDKVLMCIGRRPNSSGLGLKSTKIEVDDHGFVLVDETRQTSDPRILAIGDLTGPPMLAHKASHEGRTAAEVVAGHRVAFEPKAIPAVVFTDPEVAWCGLTENDAAKENRPVKIARFPWQASGRASTLQRSDGLTKIIADPETDQVLGVGIVGTNAGELIAEGALAIEMGALASDIELTIHPHPTLGETIMESAEIIFGNSTHFKGAAKTH